MIDSIPDRRGLNASEASLARAFAEFGGSIDLLDGLEPGAARALRPLVRRLREASRERREEVVEEWADCDTGTVAEGAPRVEGAWEAVVRSYCEDETPFDWVDSDRMRRMLAGAVRMRFASDGVDDRRLSEDPEHFDALLRIDPGEYPTLVLQFGIFEVAQLVRDRNRRRIARVAERLSGPYRDFFVEALRWDCEVDRRELARLRDVFVTLSRHYEEFRERIAQLGLYAIARAASRRFRGRVARLRSRLPDDLGERLVRYYRMAQTSTRKGLSWRVRESLEDFLELWRTVAEDDVGDGDDV